METVDWQQRWKDGEIGFHEGEANSFLVEHFTRLNLAKGGRVFVPLCGKARDMVWLLEQGYRVAGAELSPLAVEQFFAELGVKPTQTALGKLTKYSAVHAGQTVDIFVGDIFDLSLAALGPVRAIYDRAAMVALPEPVRKQYAAHLLKITTAAPQLLICFEYDQSQMDGPPFSVPATEIRQLYNGCYEIAQIVSREVPGGLKGQCAATEIAWLLK